MMHLLARACVCACDRAFVFVVRIKVDRWMLADGRADGGLDDNDDKARRERASGLQYFVIPLSSLSSPLLPPETTTKEQQR